MPRRISLSLLLLALMAAACAAPGDPDDGGPPSTILRGEREPGMQIAIIDWATGDLSSPEAIARYARADLVAFETFYLWVSPRNADVVPRLKALNPDLVVLGYVSAEASWLVWGTGPNPPAPGTYARDWFDATRPYWSYTTEGDTACPWPGQVLLDITDPGCRAGMIDVVRRHQGDQGNELDGIFWDHFCDPLWVKPGIPGVEGLPDLDGDGIAHADDPDEQQAHRRAQEALVMGMRAAMGDAFQQVFNGSRATRDSLFARLGDGMMYEGFPQVNYGHPPIDAYLSPDYAFNLAAARTWPRQDHGGPWLLLSNCRLLGFTDSDAQSVVVPYADLNRAVALLLDLAVSYHDQPKWIYGWPEIELDLGRPLGPLSRDADVLTRTFERGEITVRPRPDRPAAPLDYRIVQDGVPVQILEIPEHLP